MAQTIKLKNSGTSSNTPSSLEHGELAINYADGKIFYKNSSNNIVEFTTTSGSFLPLSGGTLTGTLAFGDSTKLKFGNSQDLEIYHDSLNSYINDTGTGDLIIKGGNDILFLDAVGNTLANMNQSNSVELYFGGSKKFETTSTGIDVTGTISSGALTISTGTLSVNSGTTDTVATFTSSDTGVAVNFVASDNSMQIATSSTDGILKNNGAGSLRFFNNGSERARIDSSGNLLVGKTSTGVTTLGFEARDDGILAVNRNNSTPVYFGRKTSDGAIIEFRKDTDQFASIGVMNTDNLYISGDNANHSGLQFGTHSINPLEAGSTADGTIDIGLSTHRFKDLHLSNSAYVKNIGGTSDPDTYINFGDVANTTKFFTGGTERMRLNANGDWMVSNTVARVASQHTDQGGCGWYDADHHFEIATTSNRSALEVSRNNANDGDIITFRKQSTVIGGVGVFSSDLYIGTGDTTLKFEDGNDRIVPRGTSGAQRDNAISLGSAGNRWHDLRLGGTAYVGEKIGVGTTTVSADIHIENSSGATLFMGDTNGRNLRFRTANSGGQGSNISSYAGLFLGGADNQNHVLIDGNGKVIIGDGASHTDDLFQIETPASGGGHGIQIRRNDANGDQQIGRILFGNNTDTDLAQIAAKTDGDGNSGDSGALLFSTQPSGGSLSERMRIDSSGNVGIGNDDAGSMHSNANKLVVGTGSGNQGMSVFAGTSTGRYAFARAVGNNTDAYDGGMAYDGNRNLTFHTNNNAERMRIDSSGNLLVGKTAADFTVAGHEIRNGSYAGFTRAGLPLLANRLSSDGDIIEFYKNTASIGSIGVNSGYFYLGGTQGTDAFLSFGASGVRPATSSGDARDAAIDLGSSSNRFKDLYLSNKVYAAYIGAGSDTDTSINFDTANTIKMFTGGLERMRIHSNGAVGIGTTTTTGAGGLLVDNDIKTNSRFGVGSLGNVATPAIHVLADTDTGIYFPNFNHIGLVTGGVERLQITSAGKALFKGAAQTGYALFDDGVNGGIHLKADTASVTTEYITTGFGAFEEARFVASNFVFKNSGTSTRAVINTSGNLLIGKTADNDTSAGIRFQSNGSGSFVRDNNVALQVNRLTGDGTLMEFRKDSSLIGSLGNNTDFFIASQDGTGLRFQSDKVLPCDEGGNLQNGSRSLGTTSSRFKDAHFSGAVNITNTSGGSYFKAVQTSNVANAGLYMQSGSHNWYTLVDTSGRYQIYDGDAVAIRVMVDTSGKLLIGGTTSSASGTTSFSASGAGQINFNASTTGGQCLLLRRVNHNGNAITFENADEDEVGSITMSSNATAYNTSSDARLKDNIEDANDSGTAIDSLQVRQFDWKSNGKHEDYGMIAQEVIHTCPNAVSVPQEDGEMMGIDYSKMVPLLLKEIQELRKRVKKLEE